MHRVQRGPHGVLVIDPDQTTGQWVLATLHHAGYQVHLTANGQDAIRRFNAPCQPLPALVLLDVALLDIPGSEIIDTLTGMPWAGDIPFLLWGEPAHADPRVVALGTRRYLSKRTADRHLLRLVGAYLRPPSGGSDGSPGRPAGLERRRRRHEHAVGPR